MPSRISKKKPKSRIVKLQKAKAKQQPAKEKQILFRGATTGLTAGV